MAIKTKICPVCGKSFEGKHNKIYCSKSCKDGHNNDKLVEHICPTCHKSFWAKKCQIYCSRECKLNKKSASVDPFEEPLDVHLETPLRGRKPLARKVCPVCGATFIVNHYNKYCSQQCRSKASWQRIRDTNEQARKLGLSYGQFATYKKLGLNPADFAKK